MGPCSGHSREAWEVSEDLRTYLAIVAVVTLIAVSVHRVKIRRDRNRRKDDT